MTQHKGEIELNSKERLACKVMGLLKADKEHPESYTVAVCMRNKIIMRAANWLTDGRAIELVYAIAVLHPSWYEYDFDNLTTYCWSLELNS